MMLTKLASGNKLSKIALGKSVPCTKLTSDVSGIVRVQKGDAKDRETGSTRATRVSHANVIRACVL